jgi:CheY-like chemotaxis protein
LLEGELQEPTHRQYLRSIRSSAGSLLQLINDILDMSKIEAGVMELRPEPTDPREICEFLHTVFGEATVRKRIKLECKVTDDLPRALLMDRIRMRQILVNLLGNAVKFTDRGEITVRVHWEKEDSSSHITLLIEVKDTGVGIPPDKLEAIFKPFVQAGAHREREKQGTGLGLAIVRRLTEAMGGTVTAVSVVGQGASFRLRFPNIPISVRLPANEKASQEAEADFSELKPALILVVDDNDENCQLIAGMFAGSHHKIVFGSDGLEAVSKARALRPDLILLDLRMPGLDGREALAQIRKSPGLEVTPIIAVTASTLLKDEADMRQAFNGHLRKPFSKRELFVEIAQFLPRKTRLSASVSEAEASEIISRKPGVSAPAELVSELRRLQSSEWPTIRDSLAINQTKVFAWKVDSLTKRWPCPPLAGYAQALAHYAEIYEVVELEKQLRRFPLIVEQLATPASK